MRVCVCVCVYVCVCVRACLHTLFFPLLQTALFQPTLPGHPAGKVTLNSPATTLTGPGVRVPRHRLEQDPPVTIQPALAPVSANNNYYFRITRILSQYI